MHSCNRNIIGTVGEWARRWPDLARPRSSELTYSFCNAHRSSPTYVIDSTATPLLTAFISSVPIFVIPIPTANSLPSASNAMGVPASSAASAGGSRPPADVRPGHIMCAPASRNRIAPRSMRTCGSMDGSATWRGEGCVVVDSKNRIIRNYGSGRERHCWKEKKKKKVTRICGADAVWEDRARHCAGRTGARRAGRIWRDDLCCLWIFRNKKENQRRADETQGLGGVATDHFTCTIDSFFGHISSNVSASTFHEERRADRMPRWTEDLTGVWPAMSVAG